MAEEQSVERGMDRRTMIRRTALVGGSLVWATPVVQSLGGSALANTSTGSPKPPDKDGVAVSGAVLLLLCGIEYFQVKLDADDQNVVCGELEDPPPLSNYRERWNSETDRLTNGQPIQPDCPDDIEVVSLSGDEPICVNYSGCQILTWGFWDGGGGEQVFYMPGDPIDPSRYIVTDDGTTICFSKTF